MLFPMTTIYAVILAILFLLMSAYVSRLRQANGIALGTGNNDELMRAVRAHGNFAEYTPIGIILMLLAEGNGASLEEVQYIGILLAIGRILHAYGIISYEARTGKLTFRIAGNLATYASIILAAYYSISVWMEYMRAPL